MKKLASISACMVFVVCACTTTPTASNALSAPIGARASGLMFGSGNRTGGQASEGTTLSATADTSSAESRNGGVMFGSGN